MPLPIHTETNTVPALTPGRAPSGAAPKPSTGPTAGIGKDAPVLDVEGLQTFFFTKQGVVRAVDNVSFQVGKAETLAIVGESGCGKSITALSLMKLIPEPPGRIMGGRITLDGVDLVLLLLSKDLPDLFGHRELAERLALPDPLPIVSNRLRLVVQVELQHLARIGRHAHRLGLRRRHSAQVINLTGHRNRVRELFSRMRLELLGDGHVRGASRKGPLQRRGGLRSLSSSRAGASS
mgnify:CR=1 FL=1